VYVVWDTPSSAVTTVVIVFDPTDKLTAPEATPESTDTPFTVTDAFESVTLGVTVTLDTPLATDDVYEVVSASKTGLKVHDPHDNPASDETSETAVRDKVLLAAPGSEL
jgi:hypothetical protein